MTVVTTPALLCLCGALLSGCVSNQPGAQAQRRFHEARAADVVLQFSSWDYTFLLRPRYDDNGFLLQVPRDQIEQVFKRMNVQRRDLALVVVGWNYSREQLAQLVAEWKNVLASCGFQRVVIIKSRADKELNGSLVIDDSVLSGSNAHRVTQL